MRTHVGLTGKTQIPDANAFGERLNPITGEFDLVQWDAVLMGPGPSLAVPRRFLPGNTRGDVVNAHAFGDWILDIPRISTLTTRDSDGHGWRVAGASAYARCSNFGAPPAFTLPVIGGGSREITPDIWWQGYQMVVDGQEQELLKRSASNDLYPGPKGGNDINRYPLVTAAHWQLSCLGKTDNGEPGEALLGLSPDGTQYVFDHMVYEDVPNLAIKGIGALTRRKASLLVTRITDRLGNSLVFQYAGNKLVRMVRSDDASIDIVYRSDAPFLVDHITLQSSAQAPRVWTYRYADIGTGATTLVGVTEPTGPGWSFDLKQLARATLTYGGATTCSSLAPLNGPTALAGTASSPSGLTGRFTLSGVRHQRVSQGVCSGPTQDIPWSPSAYDTLSLIGHTYSGAGLAPMTWSYAYDSDNTVSRTRVTRPDGIVAESTYSNGLGIEGQLLSMSLPGRVAEFTYADSTRITGKETYVASLGSTPRSRVNPANFGRVAPLTSQTIRQDDGSYSLGYNAFDEFAQPTLITQANSIPGQKSLPLRISYLNDRGLWLIGRQVAVTNANDNTEISATNYDAQGLVQSQKRFGQQVASYTYTAEGLPATVTDGNGFTVQYQDYVLGVPRVVLYPDGSRETRSINPFGEITEATDRSGVSRVREYDAAGRITRLGTPRGDTRVWNDTTIRYDYVTSAEVGQLEAGHWRQTTTRGNQARTTFFDAWMRPVMYWDQDASNPAATVSSRHAYDWRGLETFTSYPLKGSVGLADATRGVRSTFDALGRVTRMEQDSEKGVLATTVGYGVIAPWGGAGVQVTASDGTMTTSAYQVQGTPTLGGILRTKVTGSTAEMATQQVTRDEYGLPLSMTQSGSYERNNVSLTREYVYDGAKRLCRTIQPETGNTVVDYDNGGRKTWMAQGVSISGNGCGREQVPANARNTYIYDTMDRLVSVTYPAGSGGKTFTYDAVGRMTSADTGITRWTYGYNTLGLTTSETLSVDGFVFPINYSYDANGGLSAVQYPNSRTVEFAPDAWGRPTQAGRFATSARYLANGELEYFKYGNGIEYIADVNARQLASNLSYVRPGGGLLFSQDFTYDVLGNLTSAASLGDAAQGDRTYEYDAMSRLTRVTMPGDTNSQTFSYDPLNNIRRIVSGDGVQRNYQYDGFNRLTSAPDSSGVVHTYSYDARGNTVLRDSQSYLFDGANRLTDIVGKESYTYDAFGHRVVKLRTGADGGKRYYLYTRSGQLLQESEPRSNAGGLDYIYLGGLLVANRSTEQSKPVDPPPVNPPPVDPPATPVPGVPNIASPKSGMVQVKSFPFNLSVAWNAVDGATSYEAKLGNDSRSTCSVSSTNCTLSINQPNDYDVMVRACNASGCSGYALVSVTIFKDGGIPL